MFGLYRAGASPLHRAPAAMKLLGVLLATTLLLALRSPGTLAVGALGTIAAYLLAGFGPRVLLQQVWPLRWVLLVLVPYQLWALGVAGMIVTVGTLLVAVAVAALLTLTTRVSDLLDTISAGLQPLARFGVDPDRFALACALVLRSIPALVSLAGTANDARRARGLERSPRAVLVPFVVRAVRYAQATGDALVARGLDD